VRSFGYQGTLRSTLAQAPRLGRHLFGGGRERWACAGAAPDVLAVVAALLAVAIVVVAFAVPKVVVLAGQDPKRLLTFVLVATVLQFVNVDVYGRSRLSFASTGLMALGFAAGAPAAICFGFLSGVLLFFIRKARIYRSLYDMSQLALAAGLATMFYHAFRHSPHPLPVLTMLAAGALYYVVNTGLLAGAMGLEMRSSPLVVWREQFRWYFPYTVAAAGLAYGIVTAYTAMGPFGAFLFTLPPVFMMVSIRVVTVRTKKNMEEVWEANRKLSESEAHFRSLIEDADDAIAVVDELGRIGYASPALERLLERPNDEILGERVLDLIAPEQRRSALNGLRQHLADPEVPFEMLYARGESEIKLEAIARHKEGALVLTLRDITVRKEAEVKEKQLTEQLQQAQKMEAVGQLAGGIAHDFNNLLMVIMGCSELLLMQMDEDDNRRGEAEEIARTSARATALTRQLLAFSRKQVLEPQAVDLNGSVVNLQKMLERIIGTDIRLTTHLDEEVAPIFADPGQVEQVLMNLVVNARDAMDGKGLIDISVLPVAADAVLPPELEPGQYMMLAVRDNGSGMTEETKTKLFEPFFTTKGVGKGTGLGLATVYGIVHQSGGAITVDSTLGEGTTFNVYFPRHDGPIVSETVTLDIPVIGGDATVLVVDDEDGVRRFASTVLEEHGYRVFTAKSGLDALDLARALDAPIDLVLTDIVMPEMTGAALSVHLRSDRPDIKVLYMSGHIGGVEFDSSTEDARLINKPFGSGALLNAVAEALAPAPKLPALPAARESHA
jgi:PAS domain S-box-containing protein